MKEKEQVPERYRNLTCNDVVQILKYFYQIHDLTRIDLHKQPILPWEMVPWERIELDDDEPPQKHSLDPAVYRFFQEKHKQCLARESVSGNLEQGPLAKTSNHK